MKRLLLVLALFAGFSLCGQDAFARWGHRGRVRHHAAHHHHVHRPVYPRLYHYSPPIRYYSHGYHAPQRHYYGGYGGVYIQSPGFSIGIRF